MTTDTDTPTAEEQQPEAQPQEFVRETIQAPHKFSDAEKITLGDQLIQALSAEEQVEREFDSVKQEFKSRKEKAELETTNFRVKLRDGFEMRPTLARILFNHPSHGRKTFVRDDSGETIREEAMTFADQERPLFTDGNGQDATAPVEDEPCPAEEPTQEPQDRHNENAGETPLGDLLNAAAAGKPLPRVSVILEGDDKGKVWRDFSRAAKAAGWPAACIALMRDQSDKCEDAAKAIETLDAHTIRPGATDEQSPDANLAQ